MDLNTILLIIGLGAIAYIGYRILHRLEKPKEDQAMEMLQKHLFEIQKGIQAQDRTLNEQLNKSRDVLSESLQKQFATTVKMVKDVQDGSKAVAESLTKMEATSKQVLGFTEQMKSLENILKNPKQRGILGEFFLENLLSNQLPPTHFKMQYGFKNGEVVDAAIFVRDKVIPVDAKFSLENYNAMMEEKSEAQREKLEKEFKSDLKKRIDETSKYVRLDENTTDFAFMFIPADGVFYNLLSQKIGTLDVNTHDLIEYAFKKHVILVSPMTFYAYLQTVMQALKALTIEKQAVEIQKRVGELGRHLNAYQDHMNKVGSHLSTTVNAYNNAGKEYGKIDKDVIRITEGGVAVEADIPVIDRPGSFSEPGGELKLKLGEPVKRMIAQED
ncbi:DNA recombination protein RmuC [Patescibacteria group bacterium]|nr:DNA recombination protein RmuC [Patescibacteria group bacterium]MBU1016345.1 DNA recombination protein RmuC [Patescibacteria group bacterium]MBU1685048.1 DNA recombination protein RmuC [Patescibacteria group bacterium]MBU1938856.1 DNA recombination protein RmuC [Patescibacteria group bacterium]